MLAKATHPFALAVIQTSVTASERAVEDATGALVVAESQRKKKLRSSNSTEKSRRLASEQTISEAMRFELQLMHANLLRAAAGACLSGGETDAADGWAQAALAVYQAVRIGAPKSSLSFQTHLEESDLYRILGLADQAIEAIKPIESMVSDARREDHLRFAKAVVAQQIANILDQAPDQALARAKAALMDPGKYNRDRLQWIASQAQALIWQKPGAAPATEEVLATWYADLELDDVHQSRTHGPYFERLALVDTVERATGLIAMAESQRLMWCQTLSQLGRADEALVSLQRATAVNQPKPGTHLVSFQAQLLNQAGRHQEAQTLIQNNTVSNDIAGKSSAIDEQAPIANQEALTVQLAEAKYRSWLETGDPSDLAQRFERLIIHTQQDPVRLWALERLASLHLGLGTSEQMLGLFKERETVVSSSIPLRYAQLVGQTTRLLRGKSQQHTWEDLTAASQALEEDALSTNALQIAHAARLVRCRLALKQPEAQPRQAIAWLTDGFLPVDMEGRSVLLLNALLSAGDVEGAFETWQVIPSDTAVFAADGLDLAQALAVSSTTATDDRFDYLQQAVIDVVKRLITEPDTVPPVEQWTDRDINRAGAALIDARAYAEAEHLLVGLPDSGTVAAVRGRALLEQNRIDDAIFLLTGATFDGHDNPQVYLVLADAYNRMEQPKKAIVALRDARAVSTPGTDEWWRLTLTLADAFIETDDQAGATRLLQTSAILHAAPRLPTLRSHLERLLEETNYSKQVEAL